MPNYPIFDFCQFIFHCSIKQTQKNRWEKYSVCSIRQFCLFAICGKFIFLHLQIFSNQLIHSRDTKLSSFYFDSKTKLTGFSLYYDMLIATCFSSLFSSAVTSIFHQKLFTFHWNVRTTGQNSLSTFFLVCACLACFAYYPLVSACLCLSCLAWLGCLGCVTRRSDVKETKSFSQTVAKSNVWTPPANRFNVPLTLCPVHAAL